MEIQGWWPLIRLVIFIACLAVVYLEYTRKPSTTAPTSKAKRPDVKDTTDRLKNAKKSKVLAVDFTTAGGSLVPKTRTLKKPRKSVKLGHINAWNRGENLPSTESSIIIFYSTLTGSSEKFAKYMQAELSKVSTTAPTLLNLDYIDDWDEYFVSPSKFKGYIYLFVLPSYETESPLDSFIESLSSTYNDFRIDSRTLHGLAGFSVFGIGDSEGWPEESKFCYQSRQVDKLLGKLGGRRFFPMGSGCVKTNIEQSMAEYIEHLSSELKNPSAPEELDIVDSDEEEGAPGNDNQVMDVEDLGKSIDRIDGKPGFESTAKEMVAKDSPTHKALTKQGYTIVGSHSGVKICRWTKSALRGRGSCYKFAFYGIRSHLCMETTPSLSCSNKCVFCWRHGTNPVGTTWRWQVDAPQDILDGALAGHYQKIKQMRGVPGVQAARFAEAFTVKHCALSLVGEPIFYPHINEFLAMLHAKHISSFLVCNAQHPKELRALKKATQLYVSIDASDKETLKRVDRPLHRDFWERMMECLDIIREKENQRTVYRLTLVKGFNADEVDGYADLVERGRPCFIEVKGVTFCGNSKTQQLTMNNVPFYDEVQMFVEALAAELNRRGLDYGLATEHAHSCCVLLAQRRFFINSKWYTHIDYPRYFELLESGADFGPMDYIAETPSWAFYGSKEGGFNPEDTPHRRGKPVDLSAK